MMGEPAFDAGFAESRRPLQPVQAAGQQDGQQQS